MSLHEYHRKRDFKQTKEPYGKAKSRATKKLKFVIQKHAASHLHYDFRLELDGVLKSWAVPKGPSLDPKVKHLAIHVEDHPIEYGNFEGIIPKGEYGGGTVMVWDKGYWQPLDENVHSAYHKGNMTFALKGQKLQGQWKLIRTRGGADKGGKEQWLLFKIADEFSQSEAKFNVTEQDTLSVKTGRSLQDIGEDSDRVWTKKGEAKKHPNKKKIKKITSRLNIAKVPGATKKAMPRLYRPELATLVLQVPAGDAWLHEIKWDGYRILAQVKQGKVTLFTRRGNDWTDHFPGLVTALNRLFLKDIILDGELVALNKNHKADFQLLQNSLEEQAIHTPLIYHVFDLLYYDGYSLMSVPLIDRKASLQKVIASHRMIPEIKYNDHIIGDGAAVFEKACALGLEGIIAKKSTSYYLQKRSKDWLKIKCTRRQEFVIGGYTEPRSSRQYFGALLLGYFAKDELIYCGKVGTGFNSKSLHELYTLLKKIEQNKNSFFHYPEKNTRGIHWVKPKLVVEVDYMTMTGDGLLRHPSFKGLRADKKATSVTLEVPKDMPKKSKPHTTSSKSVAFTNLDKVFYPQLGITKQDLINYYELVADWILPHIKNRPLSLVRCPHGTRAKCFYQKHFNDSVPSTLKPVPIEDSSGIVPYIYLTNLDGLLGIVQMGVLELHPWGSTIKNVEQPDRIVFDLDPAPGVKWADIIDCALLLRQFLTQLGLISFVKTTGGKGLHVVIPIRPTLDWEQVKEFTKRVADLIVELHPDKYIATMSKAKRTGKIFIDYLRNSRGATSIAPYSTRAKPDATIATPLYWEELDSDIRSDTFTLENIKTRLKEIKNDPWSDMLKTKQSITIKMRKKLGCSEW